MLRGYVKFDEKDIMLVNIKKNIARFIKPRGKISILSELKPGSRILDIGCGNEQAKKIKKILPDCYYVGIDVGYYNNTNSIMADEFHIVDPSDFTDFISKMSDDYDGYDYDDDGRHGHDCHDCKAERGRRKKRNDDTRKNEEKHPTHHNHRPTQG